MDDYNYAPMSALQHLIFCERQCALIHVERMWEDNDLTIEGNILHAKVDNPYSNHKSGIKNVRRIMLRSDLLQLVGYADIIEIKLEPSSLQIYEPIEYKHSNRHLQLADDVQICAQAIAIEEMSNTIVNYGSIYYGKTRRRRIVNFDDNLRKETFVAAKKLHRMLENFITPTVRGEQPKCKKCSLKDICMPSSTSFVRKNANIFGNDIL